MNLTIVLHNIRSTYNVGAILRSADGVGVKQMILSGYTPKYDDGEILPHLRAKLNHQIEKAALGAEKALDLILVKELAPWLEKNQKDYMILGLENNLNADEIKKRYFLGSEAMWRTLKNVQDGDILLILGEEVNGIPEDIRKYIRYYLEIPMQGVKESFNVSVASSIAMWALKSGARI